VHDSKCRLRLCSNLNPRQWGRVSPVPLLQQHDTLVRQTGVMSPITPHPQARGPSCPHHKRGNPPLPQTKGGGKCSSAAAACTPASAWRGEKTEPRLRPVKASPSDHIARRTKTSRQRSKAPQEGRPPIPQTSWRGGLQRHIRLTPASAWQGDHANPLPHLRFSLGSTLACPSQPCGSGCRGCHAKKWLGGAHGSPQASPQPAAMRLR